MPLLPSTAAGHTVLVACLIIAILCLVAVLHRRLQAQNHRLGNAIDNTTGTIELRATYPNADSRLVPGQLVDVGVTLNALKSVTVVPHDAVNLGPNGRFVYVVKDGKAEMRDVKVLYDDGGGGDVAVQGAIKPGDAVITDGQLRVLPGKPVAIVEPRAGARPTRP